MKRIGQGHSKRKEQRMCMTDQDIKKASQNRAERDRTTNKKPEQNRAERDRMRQRQQTRSQS